VIAFLEVENEDEEQVFESDADVSLTWLHRNGAPAGATDLLERAVRELEWPSGKVFAWVTAEVRMASAVRRFVRESHGLTRHDYKIQAYWRRGMTEPERLDRVKQNIAPLIAEGTDPVELYNERGMAADDPTLTGE
jgi:NADPH-dependent ferric siderophore reductase